LLGFEGGYRQLLTKFLFVDVAVFHNHYRDLQSFGPITPQPGTFQGQPATFLTIQYQNAISGSTDGFEIAPTVSLRSWWKISGSYSFVTSGFAANGPTSDISSTGSVPTYEGSTPRSIIAIQSEFNLPHRFEFDQFYRFASRLPAQKVAAYQTMDLRLGWKFSDHFEASLVGQNLFQPFHFEWGTGDPSQPLIGIRRSAYLKLTWTQ
jgi:iron complex outermembrane receptor protein